MPTSPLLLRDIHQPDAIGWWPPAIGWWLLAIFIPLLIGFSYWFYKRMTRKTALKAAHKNLLAIKLSAADNREKLRELSMLIRRVAISINPRQQVASLTGRAWLDFLDQSLAAAPFSTGYGQLLIDAPYRNNPVDDQEISQLISLCESWLKAQTHSAKKPRS
ncbi:MAG: DUF4381 domain-containing protein [Methylococcales bacterium]|nr:DUF4381 domain-containing protein [Methylococcales bacterium]